MESPLSIFKYLDEMRAEDARGGKPKRRKLTDPKSIQARRSREKGVGFERQVAIWFRAIFPEARRHLEYHRMDATGIDLINTGQYRIQCKKFKKYAPLTCIQEVQCDRAAGHVPVLVTAGDNLEALACLPLKEFLRLVAIADLVG